MSKYAQRENVWFEPLGDNCIVIIQQHQVFEGQTALEISKKSARQLAEDILAFLPPAALEPEGESGYKFGIYTCSCGKVFRPAIDNRSFSEITDELFDHMGKGHDLEKTGEEVQPPPPVEEGESEEAMEKCPDCGSYATTLIDAINAKYHCKGCGHDFFSWTVKEPDSQRPPAQAGNPEPVREGEEPQEGNEKEE